MAEGGIRRVGQEARTRALLILGLCAGIAAATWSLREGPGLASLPDGAVARVGERLIARSDWDRAVAAVESERRTPLDAAGKRKVLERLVDEELLVQQGLALGMAEQDRRLRAQLVQEVMATAPRDPEPDETALRRYFEENIAYFMPPGRLRVAIHGASDLPPVPDTLLAPSKLQAYIGPELTRVALGLAPGTRSEPQDGGVVIELRELEAGTPPAFEEVADAVRADWRRRADEAAVRRLLAELRAARDIVVRP